MGRGNLVRNLVHKITRVINDRFEDYDYPIIEALKGNIDNGNEWAIHNMLKLGTRDQHGVGPGTVDVEVVSFDGMTPLMIAAKMGDKKIVHNLFSRKVDPNVTIDGKNALMLAIESNCGRCVFLILLYGGDGRNIDLSNIDNEKILKHFRDYHDGNLGYNTDEKLEKAENDRKSYIDSMLKTRAAYDQKSREEARQHHERTRQEDEEYDRLMETFAAGTRRLEQQLRDSRIAKLG